MSNPFPFQLMDVNGQYTIIASLESEDLYDTYHPFFQKHGYENSGYCWEGHIKQILEKTDKELLKHIEFDPEAESFYAYIDSQEAQQRFINLLSPIFNDMEQLEKYVKSADRSRVDS